MLSLFCLCCFSVVILCARVCVHDGFLLPGGVHVVLMLLLFCVYVKCWLVCVLLCDVACCCYVLCVLIVCLGCPVCCFCCVDSFVLFWCVYWGLVYALFVCVFFSCVYVWCRVSVMCWCYV